MATTTKRKRLIERREVVQERLDLYYQREQEMLKNPVQSYTIGSRQLTKYTMDLNALQNLIKELEEELDEIDSQLANNGRRASRAIVPRDW